MAKKGQITTAHIVKCGVLYCEAVSRTENVTEDEAVIVFRAKGWEKCKFERLDGKRLWVCPNSQRYH